MQLVMLRLHQCTGGGGGTPHMKGVGMLVISLRGVNFGFWSRLGCFGKNAFMFSHEGLVQGCTRKNIKIYTGKFDMYIFWSLLGVKKSLRHAQIGLLQGFNSKFPTGIPTPFICGVHPSGTNDHHYPFFCKISFDQKKIN